MRRQSAMIEEPTVRSGQPLGTTGEIIVGLVFTSGKCGDGRTTRRRKVWDHLLALVMRAQ